MKTKLLTTILATVALFALSFTQNTFAQDGEQPYLNVLVINSLGGNPQPGAEVWVENSSQQVVLGPAITGSNGWVGFSLYGFSAGTYVIYACAPARPNNTQGGYTIWYYPGYGSATEKVILGNPYLYYKHS